MKAGDTINIRVVVKGFLRCLSFGRRMFIWVSVWLIVCACFCEVLQCFMTRNHWVWYRDVCGRLSFKNDMYIFFDVFV